MNVPRVFVTGARGFVGEALVLRLLVDRKFEPVAAVRGASRLSGLCPVEWFSLGEAATLPSLRHVDVVVHAAARVHVMHETATDALSEYRRMNVEGTLDLARRAVEAGVKRFVFISSIKVNGETTARGVPFKADDEPSPSDPYGVSKFEAEEALKALARETGLEVVIIRPPLVYGPGVKANFRNMLNWLSKGVPLPLGCITNRRSLVSIGNLVDFIVTCIDHPRAANQTFLVSDGEDLSTTQLLRRLGNALGKRAWLLPLPMSLLKLSAAVLNKRSVAQRICGSLQVDIDKNRTLLGWSPPINVDKAMQQTARDFMEKHPK